VPVGYVDETIIIIGFRAYDRDMAYRPTVYYG